MNPTQGVSNFPWVTGSDDDLSNSTPGGRVVRLKAGGTLVIGDAVYMSGDLTVNKAAASAAQQKLRIGIIVGGQSFNSDGEVATDSNLFGQTAATVNQWVLVCFHGVTYVKVAAAIAVGRSLVLDTATAGRVKEVTNLSAGNSTLAIGGSPAIGTLAVSGAPGIGTLAVSGAPALGTLEIGAGATPVTSTAANGAIITGAPALGTLAVSGAPDIGTLAVSGSPAIGTLALTGTVALAGESAASVIGLMLEASSGANEYKRALIYLA